MLDIFEFETVADPSAATAGAPAGDGPSQTAPAAPVQAPQGGEPEPSSAGATETAPAWTPEQIAALRTDPDFQSFLSEEASAIADARFNQQIAALRTSSGAPTVQPGEPGLNLNEFLDPYGDNFGTNLGTVLGGILQRIDQSLEQRFQPFEEQAQASQQAEFDTVLSTAVTDHAQTLGGLRGGDAAIHRVMADVRNRYMPEAERVYGRTDRAAQVAIDKAVRAELSYQQQIAGTSAQENAEHLATVNGAPAAVNGGAAALTTTNGQIIKPGNGQIAQKYGAIASSINGH